MTTLDTTISDLGHSLLSLGNHVLRAPVRAASSRTEALEYAAREADRIAGELRNAAEESRQLEREHG